MQKPPGFGSSFKQRIPPRVFRKYVTAHLLGLIPTIILLLFLKHIVGFSLSLFFILLSAWCVKDALLFPFVWKSYDHEEGNANYSLTGEKAKVVERLDPLGIVKIHGVRWRARIANDKGGFDIGETVSIVGREGLTLLVDRVQ